MSFEEKGTWVVTAIAIANAVLYFATILAQLPTTAVGDIDYQGRLLIGDRRHDRPVHGRHDRRRHPVARGRGEVRPTRQGHQRLGEYVGGILVTFGMLVPFGLALAEAPHFWIANAMYLIFVLSGLCAAVVKVVIYRRGF